MHTIFLLENLKGIDHLGDLDVDGKILEWISGKLSGTVWIGFIWLRIGPLAGSCEQSKEPSGSIKGRVFLD
jgi:hypothetical protein